MKKSDFIKIFASIPKGRATALDKKLIAEAKKDKSKPVPFRVSDYK